MKTVIDEMMYYIPLLTVVIGTLGSCCNIIVFTSRKFRLNSCVFYFLCSTTFDLMYLLISVLSRIIQISLNDLRLDESILFCKFRTYFVVLTPLLSTLYLMFASIDRCLSTSFSKKWRDLSDRNIARRISLFTLIFSLISSCHIIYFFELEKKDLGRNVFQCVPRGDIYKIFFGIFVLLSSSFVVYLIMFISTTITLIRIRKSQIRMGFLADQRRNQRHRNINRHLLTTIFIQIGLGMLFTFFRCGFLVFTFWTNNLKKSSSQIDLQIFFDKFSLILYYLNFAKSFPVNILTSQLFYRVFKEQIHFFIQTIFCLNHHTNN